MENLGGGTQYMQIVVNFVHIFLKAISGDRV